MKTFIWGGLIAVLTVLCYSCNNDEEENLVKENSLLELKGLGKLDATWTNKGFNICRKTINSLQIELYENATGEEFNFYIIIENEGETK